MATETWVLNETLIIDATVTYKVNFTTNNESKTSFEIRYVRGDKELQYDGSLVYSNGTWLQEAYRTVTFETAPTGDLLAWLQANGTKQSSTPRLSVDVSTLAGWANLSAGEKSITIVAKASGFKDSAPSAAVQVTKAASTKTLAAGTYKFIDAPDVSMFTYPTGVFSDFNFTSNGKTFTRLVVRSDASIYSSCDILYIPVPSGWHDVGGVKFPKAFAWGGYDEDYTWIDVSAYQTITLATDQQVSADFYEWAITGGNLVAQPSMPAKGDIITLDSKQYRVLKTEGTVAEVLAMYNSTTSQKFDTSGTSNVYANSDLDVYLSQTFYNSLSSAMQNAIVAKTFQQDSWKWNGGSSAIANYAGTYGTSNYTLSLMSRTFGSSISRKCYVLSCQDVIDYLGVTTSMGSADTTLTSENVWKMFWNQTTSQGPTYPWLHSADASNSDYAFYPDGGNGSLNRDLVDNASAVRPAFQIDLSKISWS